MYMDLVGLEELRDALFAASAAFDEGAYLSKTLLNELNEDAVFNLFPPAEAAENDLNAALCSLLRLKETLYDLAKAAGCALECCDEAEQTKIDQIKNAEPLTGEDEA